MEPRSELVGRRDELRQLTARLNLARAGTGGLVLVGGEAGVGKTRLLAELERRAGDAVVACGAAGQAGGAPYGALVAALRAVLRIDPRALDGCGPLAPALATLLPELRTPARTTDRATLFEAILAALAHLALSRPLLVVLEDLHWSDEATLELLSAVGERLRDLPVLVVATYRTDGLPRVHGLRRLRHELRRAGRLEELSLEPLELADVALLLGAAIGAPAAPSLVRTVHDATQGTPFFVEAVADALRVSGALCEGPYGVELADHGEVPVPDTIRDAVLVTASELTPAGRAAAEAAAVAGEAFDLDLVSALSSAEGVADLLESGLAVERDAGTGVFRHALAREALYADVPWLRRRALHRALAEAGEASGAPAREVAEHWLGARCPTPARDAFLRAAEEAERVNAFRDGADAGRRALDLWPDDEDGPLRSTTLERYAYCAELAGELAEAARAWRELVELRTGLDRAHAQRRLATVLERRGEREPAIAMRAAAAESYGALGAAADAALELLAMANQQRLEARHGEAVVLAARARAAADECGRLDLRLRALGIEGIARAKQGDYEEGLDVVRGALAMALEHELSVVAADLYQRLSVALYDSGDLRHAEEALDTALDLCRLTPDGGVEVACATCLAYVLRERGEWARAADLSRELVAAGSGAWVAEGILGSIHCYEGRFASARRLLTSSQAVAHRLRHFNMTVDTAGALARLAAAEGDDAEAVAHCDAVLARWADSDDHHYAIPHLRFAASFASVRGDNVRARACADALGRIAGRTGHPDALAALGCAIGETALLDGDARTAVEQFGRALELHDALDMPFERAQVLLRGGAAASAAGEREEALDRLGDAYRLARRLGARPLASEAARAVALLGESVSGRLGVRAAAAAAAEGTGLSRRELEVMRMVSVGRTNREIAEELFLSPRTVDMHVRNILRKLDCRSRVEAAHRASELGLLTG